MGGSWQSDSSGDLQWPSSFTGSIQEAGKYIFLWSVYMVYIKCFCLHHACLSGNWKTQKHTRSQRILSVRGKKLSKQTARQVTYKKHCVLLYIVYPLWLHDSIYFRFRRPSRLFSRSGCKPGKIGVCSLQEPIIPNSYTWKKPWKNQSRQTIRLSGFMCSVTNHLCLIDLFPLYLPFQSKADCRGCSVPHRSVHRTEEVWSLGPRIEAVWYVCVCCSTHNATSYVAISSIYIDIIQGWRTKAQIIALHGGDIKAAEEIISQKEGEGLVDHHPDSVHLKTYYATFPNEWSQVRLLFIASGFHSLTNCIPHILSLGLYWTGS